MNKDYDVFISHKTTEDGSIANRLVASLESHGLKCWIAPRDIPAGRNYASAIVDGIKQSSVFLLLFSQYANQSDDIVREVQQASSLKRPLLTVRLDNTDFSPALSYFLALPQGVGPFARSENLFDGVFEHVRAMLDGAEALVLTTVPQKPKKRRLKAIAVALATTALAATGFWFKSRQRSYPSTRAETQQVNAVISAVSKLATAYESAVEARLTLISKARQSVEVADPAVYESEESLFRHSMRETKDALDHAKPDESLLSSLRDSPIDTAVLRALSDMADFELDDAALNLPQHLGFYVRKDNSMSKADKLHCIDLKKTDCELQSRSFATGVIELFLPVSKEATAEFRKISPTFVAIPRLSGEWTRDKETLEREQESLLRQMEASANELRAIVGDMNRALGDTMRDFENTLVSMGASQERAAEISGKQGVVSSRKSELADLEARLAEKREEAYRKFRPLGTDNPGILWGKVLRFRKIKMPEAALECLDFLEKADSPDFPKPVIRAMGALVRLGAESPIAGGVMVTCYEPPATSHAVFLLGDIISYRDGVQVLHYEDCKTTAGSRFRFWRLDDAGVFRSHEETLPPDQPRIGLVEIAEKDE